ncbi:hypothetical protein OIU76_018352 [Salix suchowensis]|nr:hypothetical protein OIU76_018352 [Salix suchowensis]
MENFSSLSTARRASFLRNPSKSNQLQKVPLFGCNHTNQSLETRNLRW